MEKDQAIADLNSVEKSLADLFRRYEKMKDVLEGFRKVTCTCLLSVFSMAGIVSNLKCSLTTMANNLNISRSIQNEEVLKKCAQEYLSRVRKEEQRYQALKIHAEEKLDK